MVKIINNVIWKGNDFYKTIWKFHNKQGLPVLLKTDIMENPYKREEEQLEVTYNILKPLKEAVMTTTDELGNKKTYIEKENIPETVKSWLNLKHDEKGNNEFVIYPKSKAFWLVNFALQKSGAIPKGNTNGFSFDWDEIQETLQELKCNLKVEKQTGLSEPYFAPVPIIQ